MIDCRRPLSFVVFVVVGAALPLLLHRAVPCQGVLCSVAAGGGGVAVTTSRPALVFLPLFSGHESVAPDLSQGPTFVREPPGKVEFCNNTRAWVDCVAVGHPPPVVRWVLASGGGDVHDVSRLRTVVANGTLLFHSFAPENYRQDVHAASYRCLASNALGTVVSREVWVRAVVVQRYEVQVYDEFVITGNTGVLKCHIPTFVTDYVTVTDWVVTHSSLASVAVQSGGKYLVLPSGELHILGVSQEDGASSYNCRTYHRLTKETKTSSTAGRLIVTAPQGSVSPRITDSRTVLEVEAGATAVLPCAAQGYPVPTYSWFVKRSFDRWEPVATDETLDPTTRMMRRVGGSLLIDATFKEDSATYLCLANNSIGSEKSETVLSITVPLTVRIEPAKQVVDLEGVARMRCLVSGHPVSSLVWLHNGQSTVQRGPEWSIQSARSLDHFHIESLNRSDVGMYQCFARNNHEVVHGVAELRIGDASPELHHRFTSKTLHPGASVSVSCHASGNPHPRISWALDDLSTEDEPRFVLSSYVSGSGLVVGHLNISSVRSEDGGEFSCNAFNRLGSVRHSARINVYGAPYIRPTRTVSAMAAADVLLKCPYSGYPIEAIFWEKDSLKLPLDRRQRVFPNGTMQIINVQPLTDAGHYTCVVHGPHGQSASRDLLLSVLVPPGIAPFSFQGDQFVEGMRVRATCFVSKGDLPIAISWLKDGQLLTPPFAAGVNLRVLDEYSNVLTVDSLTPEHSGNYTCQAHNSVASANYTAQLVVNVSPRWTVEPRDANVLVGSNVTLDCVAHGAPPPTVTWLKVEGTSVPGDYREVALHNPRIVLLENGSLTVRHAMESDEGEYVCQASNGIGAGLSRVVHVAVNVPPYFEQRHRNYTLSKGQEATLTCTAHGDVPMLIWWLVNGHRLTPSAANQAFRYVISEKDVSGGKMSQLTVRRPDIRDTAIFTCVANNSFGHSEAFQQLIVQEPPDSPTRLKVVASSSRSVRLSWTPPFNGNTKIVRYLIQYKKTDEAWSSNAPSQYVSGTEVVASILNLLPDSRYHFRILAENKVGLSPPSDVLSVNTEQEAPSGSPQNIRVQSTDSQTLRVTWLPPKKDLVHGEILGYNVGYRLLNSSEPFTFKKMDAADQGRKMYQFFLKNLKRFTKYAVVVQAFNQHGNGPNSVEVEAHTIEDVPSKPPQRIVCSAVSSQSLRLTWEPPPLDRINGLLVGYKVVYKRITKWPGTTGGQTKVSEVNRLDLQGLDINANYSIQVLAFTKAGDGVRSDPTLCATAEDVPEAPADIKVMVTSAEVLLVVWRPPTRINGRLIRYTVYVRTLDRNTELEITKHAVGADVLHLEARPVTSHRRYEFWVTASTAVGEGKSTRVVSHTLATTIPARVASFGHEVVARWRSNATFPCRVVGVPPPRVQWKYGHRWLDPGERTQVLANGSFVLGDIRSADTGNYTCSVRNEHGSDEITYSLVVQAPPAPPRFSVVSSTLHSLLLRWDAALDGGSPVIGYSLSYRREHAEWEEVQVEAHVRTFTVESLWCGTRYQLYMTAYSAIGPGKPSDIMTTATRGSVPIVPRQSVILTTDASSVTLSLNGWSGDGCAILYFVIEYKKQDAADWILVSNYVKPQQEPYTIDGLQPNTRYGLKVSAHNRAGCTATDSSFVTFASSFVGLTSSPTLAESRGQDYLNVWLTVPIVFACVLVVMVVVVTTCFYLRRRSHPATNLSELTLSHPVPESQSLPLKYKLVSEQQQHLQRPNGSIPYSKERTTSSASCIAPATISKMDGVDDVNPYATFQVANFKEECCDHNYRHRLPTTAAPKLHGQPFHNSSTDQKDLNYSKVSKHKLVHAYQNDPSNSDDTVPDLLYRSQDSSSSGDTVSEMADVYLQHPTHAHLQRFLHACAADYPPSYVADGYALSDFDADRMLQCVHEISDVLLASDDSDRIGSGSKDSKPSKRVVFDSEGSSKANGALTDTTIV